jgi:hypothetical protein
MYLDLPPEKFTIYYIYALSILFSTKGLKKWKNSDIYLPYVETFNIIFTCDME